MTTEPWAPVKDVAKHLRVANDSVCPWIEPRNLPAQRSGCLWNFKVDKWVRVDRCDAQAARTNEVVGVL